MEHSCVLGLSWVLRSTMFVCFFDSCCFRHRGHRHVRRQDDSGEFTLNNTGLLILIRTLFHYQEKWSLDDYDLIFFSGCFVLKYFHVLGHLCLVLLMFYVDNTQWKAVLPLIWATCFILKLQYTLCCSHHESLVGCHILVANSACRKQMSGQSDGRYPSM